MNRRQFLAATALACATPLAFAQTNTRYKIIGFTKPFQDLDHEQCADTVAEIGWDGIECPVRSKGQIELERAADELPKLIAALKKRGKEITLITTDIVKADASSQKLLRLAAQLGIKRYRLGALDYNLNKPIPPQVNEAAAAFRDIAVMNKELGITGGVQNHSGADRFGCAIWDIWTAIKDLDPRHLGTIFDIGHATIEGGLSWPIEARLMEPHFVAIYVKDARMQKNPRAARAEWVPLGEGLLGKAFFDWLKTTKFTGPISHHAEYDHGKGKEMIAKLQKDMKVLRDWLS
ncbi:MAG TPA: sugar phosphate isomerase/epimerase family protein [Verrucomicrobiae bacterium]|nr:sugar phosphate isomerase/epimerase family protein [Verrucomicrobiae bacterium]